jgi:hypothetical protein
MGEWRVKGRKWQIFAGVGEQIAKEIELPLPEGAVIADLLCRARKDGSFVAADAYPPENGDVHKTSCSIFIRLGE